jgi:hypothetical protein
MHAVPALPPPTVEQPAPYQVSFGLVTGVAARGTRRVVVVSAGRTLAARKLRGRRFTLRVSLPLGDQSVRVTTIAGGRRSSRVVPNVYGLPQAARPRVVGGRQDERLLNRIRPLVRGYRGSAAFYVESLTRGSGAAWNAKARFPAASTVKLAIAAAVLARYTGIPPPGSYVGRLLREMIVPSDDAAANGLLVWLAGSTSAGGHRVNELMRSLGLTETLMYGGYEVVRRLSGRIPVEVDEQPNIGVGKYTTAADLAGLHRAIWLAAGNKGRLRSAQPGFSAPDGRHLLWLLAHVRDQPKLDRVAHRGSVAVLHKAGWISSARHDAGLVFWQGGVFVVSVMTWRSYGAGVSSDVLAGRVAALALAYVRRTEG